MVARQTVDVLIVGAGPTGTTLAIDLARRGANVRIVDKQIRAFAGSRAKGVQPRTLEVFDDLGTIGDIIDQGSSYPKMGIHLGPLTIPWRIIARGRHEPAVPYPDTWLIPQNRTVQTLHRHLQSMGTRIDLGTELAGFTTEKSNGVAAQLTTHDGFEDVRARYLIGADGAGSLVRKHAGIEFTGSTDEADRMLIVDAAVDNGPSRDYWHVWPGLGGRFVGACPLPHSDLFQWMIRLAPGEEPPGTREQITRRLRSGTGNKRLTVQTIEWLSVFRPNIRLAAEYRRGPVLLAGDAAHVHTPAGAQGLNTGIGDAYNLGWKLDQVLHGADETLLDTYETERRPVGAHVLGLSTKKYDGLAKLDPSSIRRGKGEKQLSLTYHGGPLASAAEQTRTLKVGDRAPDAELFTRSGERVRLFDMCRGPHFTAIGYGTLAAAAAAELDWPANGAHLQRWTIQQDGWESPPDRNLTDPAGGFARTYGLARSTLLLVRPDGYIGHIAAHDMVATTQMAIRSMTP